MSIIHIMYQILVSLFWNPDAFTVSRIIYFIIIWRLFDVSFNIERGDRDFVGLNPGIIP